MASRSASRTVCSFIGVPSGQSGVRSGSGILAGAGLAAVAGEDALPSSPDNAAGAGAVEVSAASGTSSPSSTRMAMAVFTLTPSVPSSTRILPMIPSSTASNSIVALSVSISAMMSPEETVSPSLTSHFASVPSSIVGERAGMRISVAIVLISLRRSAALFRRKCLSKAHRDRARGFPWQTRPRHSRSL